MTTPIYDCTIRTYVHLASYVRNPSVRVLPPVRGASLWLAGGCAGPDEIHRREHPLGGSGIKPQVSSSPAPRVDGTIRTYVYLSSYVRDPRFLTCLEKFVPPIEETVLSKRRSLTRAAWKGRASRRDTSPARRDGFETKVPLNHRGGSRKILPRRRCEAGGDPLSSRARRGPRERPAPARRPADAPRRSEPLGIACHAKLRLLRNRFRCFVAPLSVATPDPRAWHHRFGAPSPARRRSATPDVHSPAGNEALARVNIVAQAHISKRG